MLQDALFAWGLDWSPVILEQKYWSGNKKPAGEPAGCEEVNQWWLETEHSPDRNPASSTVGAGNRSVGHSRISEPSEFQA
jgi:hypothetical protein